MGGFYAGPPGRRPNENIDPTLPELPPIPGAGSTSMVRPVTYGSGMSGGMNSGPFHPAAAAAAPQAPAQAAPVSYTPSPMTSQTQSNPQLSSMYDEYGKYRQGLAAGTDQDSINALQRQRDAISGMAKETEARVGSRVGGRESGATARAVSGVYQGGQRDLAGLNASLTSDARRQQLAALGGQAGVAGAAANANAGQQAYALQQWQAQQQASQFQAQLAAQQQQQAVQNQLSYLNSMSNFYSGY